MRRNIHVCRGNIRFNLPNIPMTLAILIDVLRMLGFQVMFSSIVVLRKLNSKSYS